VPLREERPFPKPAVLQAWCHGSKVPGQTTEVPPQASATPGCPRRRYDARRTLGSSAGTGASLRDAPALGPPRGKALRLLSTPEGGNIGDLPYSGQTRRGIRDGTTKRAPSSDESWSASSRGGLGQQIWPELMPTLLRVVPKMFFSTPPKANTMATISAAMPGDARTHIGVSDPDSGRSARGQRHVSAPQA
jgi:hypothetical protein